ncbi:ATP-binding protein [Nonomuraea angiospora]|uniref:ATP-binding protein n=1 Tax=Nonomuraea angiospora TaxID=46172 RepID=UPI003409A4A1
MAREHFALHYHAAAYRLIDHLRRVEGLDSAFGRYPFLRRHLEAVAPWLPEELGWEQAPAWWEGELPAWESTVPEGGESALPLLALARNGGLDPGARLALMVCGLVEEDPRFGHVFADLQAPSAERRPCLDTVNAVSGSPGAVLIRHGLVEVANREAPRASWILRVVPDLWEVLRGDGEPALAPGLLHIPRREAEPIAELLVGARVADWLPQVPPLLAAGEASAVVLRGMRGSDRRRVARALAGALGRGTLEVTAEQVTGEYGWPRIGPLATALHAIPVLVYDLYPGQAADVPALPGYAGPLLLVLGREGGLRGPAVARAVTIEIPRPSAADRLGHWRRAMNGHRCGDLEAISDQVRLPPADIRRTAETAAAIAALDGRESVTPADVRDASRTLNRQRLDTLATRLEPAGGRDRLVVTEVAGAKLLDLERRCRHRERVLDLLGPAFGEDTGGGVRALFTGPSGTGKTLAARVLAHRLGMDVYRVDLAAVVDKYVGETEKNLHRVLSRAEELDVVLLIDEGDALLGARTEVRSANDRFANLETNYLLQRLEVYQGIVVVTTNAVANVDRAFQRRMDVVVDFVEPGPAERARIWRHHLPRVHEVPPDLLDHLAARCPLTGGQIRNAALQAALLALDADGVVRAGHLEQAIATEYGKAGAVSPLDSSGLSGRSGGVLDLLEALP